MPFRVRRTANSHRVITESSGFVLDIDVVSLVFKIFPKIVGWRAHGRESMDLSWALLKDICIREAIDGNQLTLHADNGGAMKGATMLVILQKTRNYPLIFTSFIER